MEDASTGSGQGFGLMFYNARWYDPYLNHFTQPDSIVPDPSNPQSYDRYAYSLNNPVRYTDPSGHNYCDLLNNNNLEDCTSGEQHIASITRKNLPSWDQAFIKNVKMKDISRAEAAYTHFTENVSQFAEYYVNPTDAPLEYDALELFAGYSTLHTTADQLIWNGVAQIYGMPAAEALYDARLHNTEVALGNSASNSAGWITAASIILPIDLATYNYANPPGPDWVWMGDPKLGKWYNPNTGEALRIDYTHHGETHYDYTSPEGDNYWVWFDGTIDPKNKR